MNRILSNQLDSRVDENVVIAGWLQTKRSHGKILFFDVRDRAGITQVIFLPGFKDFEKAQALPIESVVEITGTVVKRPQKLVNENIGSGNIEIQAHELNIISTANQLPFDLNDTQSISEETRLKYRYLDLRSPRMKSNVIARSRIYQFVIDYLAANDFIYIQTPLLSKSTPEGARDYLVPSRKHLNKFFALPQSPQQYKQLLMVAGMERYFQISPCFRDEDSRADRSPGEFYQIDMEMSFVTQDDILNITEDMFCSMIKKLYPDKKITLQPFPRLKYDEVIKRYGTDKPDLRKNKDDSDELAFAWIVDFPLFTKQSQDDFFHGSGKSAFAPSHHMFTAPKTEDIQLLDTDPSKARAYQHDLVLNGVEVGGGSIRIHDPKIQQKIWDLIGFSNDQKEQFKHLIEAFKFGVPPHGGIAPGFDRIIAILQNEKNIREVIAFPLNGEARDLLMDAPSSVNDDQLKELKIKTVK